MMTNQGSGVDSNQVGGSTAYVLSICSVAALGGLLRTHGVGVPVPPGFFILMVAAAPLTVMVLLSLLCWAARRRR